MWAGGFTFAAAIKGDHGGGEGAGKKSDDCFRKKKTRSMILARRTEGKDEKRSIQKKVLKKEPTRSIRVLSGNGKKTLRSSRDS